MEIRYIEILKLLRSTIEDLPWWCHTSL